MNSISNDFANLSDEEKQTNIIKFRQSDYDYIIVDMPPAMNDFTEHVLTVCDYVYVPIELGTFAVQGLARVTQKSQMPEQNMLASHRNMIKATKQIVSCSK